MDAMNRINAALDRVDRASEEVSQQLEKAQHQSQEKAAVLKALRADIASLMGALGSAGESRNG